MSYTHDANPSGMRSVSPKLRNIVAKHRVSTAMMHHFIHF